MYMYMITPKPRYLHSVHGSSGRKLLVLVTELRDLQEGIDAIAFQTMQLEATGPILGVDATEGQAHAEAEVGRSHGQRGQRRTAAPRTSGRIGGRR